MYCGATGVCGGIPGEEKKVTDEAIDEFMDGKRPLVWEQGKGGG